MILVKVRRSAGSDAGVTVRMANARYGALWAGGGLEGGRPRVPGIGAVDHQCGQQPVARLTGCPAGRVTGAGPGRERTERVRNRERRR